MKKILKNLLALFVTGTMLAGVGCKDYDDDINDLKQEVEDLKGQIALKADASALQALSEKFDAIDFDSFLTKEDLANYVTEERLGEALSDYVKESDFESKVLEIVKAQGYQTESDVKALIDGMMTKEDVLALFEDQTVLADLWTGLKGNVAEEIKTALANADLTEAQKQQAVLAVLAAIQDKTSDTYKAIDEAVAGILGEDFATYMEQYLEAGHDVFTQAVNDTVMAQFEDETSALVTEIKKLIAEGQVDLGGNEAYLQTTDLKAKFEAYDAAIEAIWSAITDLAGRIQSIVYVPSTADQEVRMGGYHIGTGNNRITLATMAQVEMAFRVAPAKLAATLAERIKQTEAAGKVNVSFIPEEVTRAEGDPINYLDVEATDDGKLVFTVEGNVALYEALAAQGKTYAVALCLSQEDVLNDDDSVKNYGFEITSPYVVTNGASNDVTDKFVLGYEEDNTVVEYNTKAEYEMPWNSTEKIKLFGNYALYYKVAADNYLTLDEASDEYNWDEGVAAALAIRYTHQSLTYQVDGTGADAMATQTQFAFTPANNWTNNTNKNKLISVKVKTGSKDNVADVVTLKDKVAIKSGSKVVNMATNDVEATLTVIGDIFHELNFDLNFQWFYTNYAAPDYAYVTKVTVPEDKKMNWEVFNQLPTTFDVNLSANNSVKVNGTATLTFERTTAINEESTQQFTVTLKNYVTGSGEVSYEDDVEIDPSNDTEKYVKFAGKVALEGLPALNYAVTTTGSLGAGYDVTLDARFNETLYAQASKYFEDAADVTAFIGALTLTNTTTKQAKSGSLPNLKLASELKIEGGNKLLLDINPDGINWNEQTEYTYTVPRNAAITGKNANDVNVFTLNLTGSYVLSNDNIYSLQPNTAHLYEGQGGANPFVYLNGKVSGNTFTLQDIELTNAYFATEQAISEGATLEFKVTSEYPSTVTGEDLPTIAGNTMTWGNCLLDKVTVKATLKNVVGEILDEKTFDVVLKAPITFDWTFFQGAVIEVPVTGTTFDIPFNILARDANGNIPDADNAPVAKDIYGNALYTYTSDTAVQLSQLAKLAAGYEVGIEFSQIQWTNPNENIANVTVSQYGKITVPASNIELVKEIKATVTVTYTYKYAWELNEDEDDYVKKEFSFEIPLTFKAAN